MEKTTRPEISKERQERLERIGNGKGIAPALALSIDRPYAYRDRLREELAGHFGKPIGQLSSLEQFYDKEVKKAVSSVTEPSYAETVYQLCRLRMEGIFSESVYRRSYHASSFYLYAEAILQTLIGSCRFWQYGLPMEEVLRVKHDDLNASLDLLLAREIRAGNDEIREQIRDALYDNLPDLPVSRTMIRAVILSGDQQLVEDLLKLLKAARLQEGLRQAILENADCGSTETLARILAFCIEEDLFRYASAMRAFLTWIGLGYGDSEQKTLIQYAPIACRALTDASFRESCIQSSNHLELYFGLWAVGAHRVEDLDAREERLLSDAEKHRRIVGWYLVHSLDSERAATRYAGLHLEETDEELWAWILRCYAATHSLCSTYLPAAKMWEDQKIQAVPNENLPAQKAERRRHFDAFLRIYEQLGSRKLEFRGNPFPFSIISLEGFDVLRRMMSLAGYDMDPQMIRILIGLLPGMNVDGKTAMLLHFLKLSDPEHRKKICDLLQDRTISVKELAVARLSHAQPTKEELDALAQALRTQSASLRKSILKVFAGQEEAKRYGLIRGLLTSEDNNSQMAGMELLLQEVQKNPEVSKTFSQELAVLEAAKRSPEADLLFARLTVGEREDFSRETGFGLYDPEKVSVIALQGLPDESAGRKLFRKSPYLSVKEMKKRMILTDREVTGLLSGLQAVFERHKDEEYELEQWDGSRQIQLFGNLDRLEMAVYPRAKDRRKEYRFSQIPYHQEFAAAIREALGSDHARLLTMLFTTARNDLHYGNYLRSVDWYEREIVKADLDMSCHQYGYQNYGRRYWAMLDILEHTAEWLHEEDLEDLLHLYRSLVVWAGMDRLGSITVENVSGYTIYSRYETGGALINRRFLQTCRRIFQNREWSDALFQDYFFTEYALETRADVHVMFGLRVEDYFRAYASGWIPVDVVYQRVMASPCAADDLRLLTFGQANPRWSGIRETYPFASTLTETVVDRILTIEEKRGELPTQVSDQAASIRRFAGGRHFVNLMQAMGKEKFYRGYSYGSEPTKQRSLSQLLRACQPGSGDSPEEMRGWIRQAKISDNRIAEAVMYAPQWARMMEKVLDWPGLTSSVWFYHAHVSEHFSAEKETETALFSPLTPQQLSDGVFDADWYQSSVSQLGEERFRLLYKAAKYITSTGSYHRRVQLFVDAVQGRLDPDQLVEEIREKRNQDKLRAYMLIPLRSREDLLGRYLFLEQFRKESRSFGAARRESERKACDTGLQNLAVNAGILDPDRLIWQMERMAYDQVSGRFDWHGAGEEGLLVRLFAEESGKVSVQCSKNGKILKSVPKALAKDPYLLELKENAKAFSDQYKRSRPTLEGVMVTRSSLPQEELIGILSHPVIAPLASGLLWQADDVIGFPEREEDGLCLIQADGSRSQVDAQAPVTLAHPWDLKASGLWSVWLKYVIDRQIVQPFKQVARELYPLTEEERQERTVSRRYAGHQVQPRQFFGALKSRGWTADYEEGLQKVVHGASVIVRLYAVADWFSPAEIEPPTLEQVEFVGRRTGECIPLEDLDPVLFSETMRDLDMAVSVASAGGVDPEASHSTIEMRMAVAQELLPLLGVENVTFLRHHARIEGKHGAYTVHMGSGITHKEGFGMLHILPVHSQRRGRIFLPFADDDPKTAEILSKILLLAEDHKIKDPAILDQIRS